MSTYFEPRKAVYMFHCFVCSQGICSFLNLKWVCKRSKGVINHHKLKILGLLGTMFEGLCVILWVASHTNMARLCTILVYSWLPKFCRISGFNEAREPMTGLIVFFLGVGWKLQTIPGVGGGPQVSQ